MSKLLKTLLVWLCVLSLPIQGVAAATMLSCGSGHRHELMSQVLSEAPVDVGHHHNVDEDHVMHEHLAAQGDATDGDHHHDAGQPGSHHHGADKCSACASCCTGVGMVATFPQWRVPVQEHASLMATFTSLLPSFLPEGLERPPRLSLA
ncbi:MAG: hypothetical protein V4532_17600 [Pseudomonadota bacterium]